MMVWKDQSIETKYPMSSVMSKYLTDRIASATANPNQWNPTAQRGEPCGSEGRFRWHARVRCFQWDATRECSLGVAAQCVRGLASAPFRRPMYENRFRYGYGTGAIRYETRSITGSWTRETAMKKAGEVFV